MMRHVSSPQRRPALRRTRKVLAILGAFFLLTSIAGASYQAVASARDSGRHPPPGRLVDAGAYSLHVHCVGTGSPTVVFESGSGGTSLDWALVQPSVAKRTRTCSYDRAGYGWSEAAPDHTLARMRRDFERALRAGGVTGPVVMVAHSFGGLLALDYASRRPERVAGLVLVDAADKATYQRMDRTFPSFRSNGEKVAVVVRVGSVLAHLGLTRLIGQPASPKTMAPDVRGAYRTVAYRPAAYRAFADDLTAFPSYVDDAVAGPLPDVPAVLLTHTDPGTMWHGVPRVRAESVWQQRQREMAAALDAELVVARGSNHFIQVQRPQLVIGAIEDVLSAAAAPRDQ